MEKCPLGYERWMRGVTYCDKYNKLGAIENGKGT